MNLLRKIVGIVLVLLLPLGVRGQALLPVVEKELTVAERNAAQGFNDTIDRLADDFVRAYVSIAEPGDYLYTTLGHAAYHMQCPAFGLDYYFTMEGESSKDAVFRFLAGKLKMGLIPLSPEEYLSFYKEEDRGVREWELNLSPQSKQRLWAVLDSLTIAWHNLPYDYYHRCCAITIVNVMNELVGKENIHYAEPWPEKFKRTPREFIYYALRGHDEWTQFFICILAGNEVDKDIPNERKFIVPMDVVEAWQKATVEGEKLLAAEYVDVLPPGIRKHDSWWTPTHVAMLLLLFVVMSFGFLWVPYRWMRITSNVIDGVVLAIITIIGIGMTYLLFVSDLCCTDWNWLYIVFNPLPALFWYWRRYWALPYAAGLVAWVLAMIFAPHLLALSSHIIMALTFCIVLLKQSPILQPLHSKK